MMGLVLMHACMACIKHSNLGISREFKGIHRYDQVVFMFNQAPEFWPERGDKLKASKPIYVVFYCSWQRLYWRGFQWELYNYIYYKYIIN